MKTFKTNPLAGLLILVLATVFVFFSCQRASKKPGEKMMEKAIENATGNKADVDLGDEKAVIKTDAGIIEVDSKAQSWPDEIPNDVPEFTYGKVKAVTTSNIDDTKTWNVIYEDVRDGFIDKYDAELKEKGFETVTMKIGDNGGSITAESDKYTIFLMGGEGNLSIAVSLKKQE